MTLDGQESKEDRVNVGLCSQSIGEQVAATESGTVTAACLVEATRAQLLRREPDLSAWVELSGDTAAQAHLVDHQDRTLPLRGISVGVKDLIDVAGLPTRAGSSITTAGPAKADADCVARLRALGAVVQGKTVTTEFGYFAPGPTRNPHALAHTPGGSSSGSAAAVGAGVVPLALGTQTAGSLTRPASYCGAAGMVLSHGSTSLAGITGLSESLDSLGLLTRSVDDLRVVFRAFAGRDAEPTRAGTTTTVFVWDGSDLDDVAPAMRGLVQRLPALLNNLGIDCRALDWDHHVRALATDHVTVMAHEAAKTRAAECARFGDRLSAPLRELLDHGRGVSGADRGAALARRDRSMESFAARLAQNALVIGPAALGPAPAGLAATGSPILSRPWQLLGLPVVVVPGAVTAAGLPLGVQIIGLPGREQDMLDLGVELEHQLRAITTWPHTSEEAS